MVIVVPMVELNELFPFVWSLVLGGYVVVCHTFLLEA